jgi:hypothetical protein
MIHDPKETEIQEDSESEGRGAQDMSVGETAETQQ